MLGVLGGGQLGRMFAMAAHRLGYRVTALDPSPDCPAAGAVDRLICAPLDDPEAWRDMAQSCAAITIETENVPAAALEYLATRTRVAPDARALGIAQDRLSEKAFLASLGLPVAPHLRVDAGCFSGDAWQGPFPAGLLPGILKASRFGYDGKGQAQVADASGLQRAFAAMGGQPCVLEARVPLAAELSVILARDAHGQVSCYPVPMNSHRKGVLDVSMVPAPLPAATAARARRLATKVARSLDYQGVLCVEFFLLEDGQLMINEIAPRPHNSGHFTLDACACSQFEQQVRVLAGLPLGSTRLLRPAAMVNLLGDVWQEGEPHWDTLLAERGVHLHLYGKREARPGRKMGHVTALGTSSRDTAEWLLQLRKLLTHAPGTQDKAGTARKPAREAADSAGIPAG
jgi:5-(carboxyamino)imidazole ribonucleotide synthase